MKDCEGASVHYLNCPAASVTDYTVYRYLNGPKAMAVIDGLLAMSTDGDGLVRDARWYYGSSGREFQFQSSADRGLLNFTGIGTFFNINSIQLPVGTTFKFIICQMNVKLKEPFIK